MAGTWLGLHPIPPRMACFLLQRERFACNMFVLSSNHCIHPHSKELGCLQSLRRLCRGFTTSLHFQLPISQHQPDRGQDSLSCTLTLFTAMVLKIATVPNLAAVQAFNGRGSVALIFQPTELSPPTTHAHTLLFRLVKSSNKKAIAAGESTIPRTAWAKFAKRCFLEFVRGSEQTCVSNSGE